MTEPPKGNEKIWATLSGLKSDYHHINESVSKLTADFHSFASIMQDRLSSSQKTPWVALAAWASIILAIVGIYSQGYIREIDRIIRAAYAQEMVYNSHISDGHPDSLEKFIEQEVYLIEYRFNAIEKAVALRSKAIPPPPSLP
jgi:hypothetical protein